MIPRRMRSAPDDVAVSPVPRTREIHVEVGRWGVRDTNDEEHREESLPRAAQLTIPSATEDDEQ